MHIQIKNINAFVEPTYAAETLILWYMQLQYLP